MVAAEAVHDKHRPTVVMLRAVAFVLGIALLGLIPLSLRADDGGTVTATVIPNALAITLEAPERKIQAGSPFLVEAKVSYYGEQDSEGSVRLHLVPADLRVRDGSEKPLLLEAGHDTRVRWQVCGEEPGTYVLMASVEAVGGEWHAESVAVVVEISGKKRAKCPLPWSQDGVGGAPGGGSIAVAVGAPKGVDMGE